MADVAAGPNLSSTVGDLLVDTTLIHERFGDVTNELLFNGLYKITQMVIGAVPGGKRMTHGDPDSSDSAALIHVFGRVRGGPRVEQGDCRALSKSGRFRCLYEGAQQPEEGSVTIVLGGVVTGHLVLRGRYQTVPVKVYGWRLDDLSRLYEVKEEEPKASFVLSTSRLVGRDLLGCDLSEEQVCRFLEGDSEELKALVGKVYGNAFDGVDEVCVAENAMKEAKKGGKGERTTATEGNTDERKLAMRQLANRGISYVSALFAVLHEGMVPSQPLVSLGSTGLDLLVVALQDAELAREFVLRGGFALLRCVLSTRGVPGSFYNKSLALVAELVRQAGEVGLRGLQELQWEKEASAWKGFSSLVAGNGGDGGEGGDPGTWNFFDVDNEAIQRVKLRGGGRKRKSSEIEDTGSDGDNTGQEDAKEAKDSKDSKDTEDAKQSLETVVGDIASGSYDRRMKGLWESQLAARVKLEDVVSDHYRGRDAYMPETAITHALLVPKVLDFFKTVQDLVEELRVLKTILMGGEEDGAGRSVMQHLVGVEESLKVVMGLLTRPKMCDVSTDGKGFRNRADLWESVLVQVFTNLMCECEVLASFTALCEASVLDGQSPKVIGAISAMHVELFSTLLDRPGCLSSGCVDETVLRSSASLATLTSSDANPNHISYKGYSSRIESMLEAAQVLASLAATDWTSSTPAKLKLSAKVASIPFTYDNVVGAGVGDVLLGKCEQALTAYLQAAKPQRYKNEVPPAPPASTSVPSKMDINGLETSLMVTLAVLQRMLVTTDPRLLQWWIPRSGAFYDLLGSFVRRDGVLNSDAMIAAAQKVTGGLFVCGNVDRAGEDDGADDSGDAPSNATGLTEVVDVLSSHLPWVYTKDNMDGVMDASEYFDVLDATFIGNTVAVTMNWDDVQLLVDDAEVLGQLTSAVNILRSYMENSEDAASVTQRLGGNRLLMRALVCATEILTASRADETWMHRVGTSMDICSMATNKIMAVELFETVTACVYHYLKGIGGPMMREMREGGGARDRRDFRGSRDVDPDVVADSLPLLQTIIKAHAAVAVDTQTMMDAGLKSSFIDRSTVPMRNARWNLTKSLRFWVFCPGLRPRVIPTALVGAVAAPSKAGCTVSFSPAAMLCLAVLLGDIFPSEWPKSTSSNVLTPEDKRYRASLTEELESCIVPLEYMISCCASSDLSYIRAATARFLCKGAGLGGGMGTFLMGILSSQFDEALLPMTFAQVGMYDARKVLELLVPLLYQPALKSAALDTTIPITLAKVVQTVITQSLTFGQAFDRVESSSLVTMALECLTALADPSISLDSVVCSAFGSKDDSKNDRKKSVSSPDMIRRNAGAAICCTILDHIAIIGGNVPLALNLLNMMSQDRRGRDCILHGIINLCSSTQGAKAAGAPQVDANHLDRPTPDQMLNAACWLIQQYQTIQANAHHAPDSTTRDTTAYVFGTLESILKRACVFGLHEDHGRDLDDSLPPLDNRTAPAKFAAQAKEATIRGETARLVLDFPCNGGYAQLLQDCQELYIFWKNQNLRPIAPVSTVTNACKLAKYVNWDIGSETMDKFCIAGILHPWLTHPTRPLNESMRAEKCTDEEYMETDVAEQPYAVLPSREQDAPTAAKDGIGISDRMEENNNGDEGVKKEGPAAGGMDVKTEATPATAQIDTQVNVDLGALPDLFQAGQGADEDDAEDDFDLYADLMPAETTEPAAVEEPKVEVEVKDEQPPDPNLNVAFSDSSSDE